MKTYTIHFTQFPVGENVHSNKAQEYRSEVTGLRAARSTAKSVVENAPAGEHRSATIFGKRVYYFSKN